MTSRIEVEGEAVAIDLGQRGVLFATMRGGPHGQDYGTDIFLDFYPPGKKKKGKFTLNRDQYPMFVTFRDLNDPMTVEKADMPSVYVQDITIEITHKRVTWGIEKWLPWLSNMNSYLSGKHVNGKELYERLSSGDFQRIKR